MDPLDDIYREIRDIRRRLRDLEALDRRDVPESSLAPHNHTAVEGDGGPLTNDEHDGYSEYAAIATPSTSLGGLVRSMSLASMPGTNSGMSAMEARSRWVVTVALNSRVPVHSSVQEMSDEVSSIAENFRRPKRISQRMRTMRTKMNEMKATMNAVAT